MSITNSSHCDICEHARVHKWFGLTNQSHCPTCHKTWSGTTVAHCNVCHETFSSNYAADMHWVRPLGQTKGDGKHCQPQSIDGLVMVGRADDIDYWTPRSESP